MTHCLSDVFVRDTYRYTGGKRRFELHWTRRKCRRPAGADGLCWQHRADAEMVHTAERLRGEVAS